LVRRLQFRSILAKSESNLTIGRYLRLIALALVDTGILIFNTIVAIVVGLISNENYRALRPYTSWSDVHNNYAQISQFPAALRTPAYDVGSVIGLYLAPLYSITFFIFFGFGEEAIKEYVAIGRLLQSLAMKAGVVRRCALQRYLPRMLIRAVYRISPRYPYPSDLVSVLLGYRTQRRGSRITVRNSRQRASPRRKGFKGFLLPSNDQWSSSSSHVRRIVTWYTLPALDAGRGFRPSDALLKISLHLQRPQVHISCTASETSQLSR
jgi:hypothetical protein